MSWAGLAAARRRDARARLPFVMNGCTVGSVARVDVDALAAWPQWITVTADAVTLHADDPDTALATINTALREQGRVRAWRDEFFAITDPATGRRLARTERAASRFWGTLTLGAHATGYVPDPRGRPLQIWIARRSPTKATDPGMLDNLIGGGVPDGQTPLQTLVREGFEEAGLTPTQMTAARPGRVIRLHRDIPEGLQFEDLHSYDLPLSPGTTPHNQDGEVASFDCLPVKQALARAASADMTVDAALVMLEFALRHRLIDGEQAELLQLASAHLWRSPD